MRKAVLQIRTAIHIITEPQGIGVRVDSFCYEGYEIPIYYDAMLSKLVVWAANRTYAIERMRRVLFEYKITGTKQISVT